MAGTRHANAHVVTGNAYISGDLEIGGDIVVDDITADDVTVDALTAGATTVTTLGTGGHITLADANNIIVSATTGTKIGTATTQKLGFYNATPVVQQAAITAPTGGLVDDAEARTAINSIITLLEVLGFIAAN